MSHQDQGSRTSNEPNQQALRRALDWLLAGADLSSIKFRDDCTWTPKGLIGTALLWAWSDEKGLKERFTIARKIGLRAWSWDNDPATSYQAFMKMLRKWTVPLMGVLMALFRQRMQTALSSRFTVAGGSVYGCDGSRVLVPRTRSNEERFWAGKGPKTKRRKRRESRNARRKSSRGRQPRNVYRDAKRMNRAQIWLTMMWHVGTGLPWDWRCGPTDSSERDHFRQMIDALPERALVTADAGFIGYWYWKAILDGNRDFVIRVGANVRLLKKLGQVKFGHNGIIYFWSADAIRKHAPPLVLRLVVIQGGRHPVYLLTSVLNPRELSDRQVAEIYRQRWGVELFFRHFKQTFERSKLRSHSADNALVEAYWSLLGLWAMSLHAEHELAKQHVPPNRISVASVLRAYRKAMREYKSRPDPGEQMRALLRQAVIDDYHRASKASRDYPREYQKQACGAPDIRDATQRQIEAARKYKKEIKKRLTA